MMACSLVVDLTGLGGDAGVNDGSVSDATNGDAGSDVVDAASSRCPDAAGPTMINAGAFCIDGTEVTNGQYASFLASAPDASLFPSTCSGWKTTFAQLKAPPLGSDDYPAVFVDWCDAYAYCKWAGKRLCGRLGSDGGALAPGGMNDIAQDEWYVACSNSGALAYPYGNTFDASACNVPERDAQAALPTVSVPNCKGALPGLLEMAGNADEWINSCESASNGPDAALDKCERRSGSFSDPPGAQQTCQFARTGARQMENDDIGFRCCADLTP